MLFSVLTRRFCGVVSKQITDTEQQTSGYVLYPPNKTWTNIYWQENVKHHLLSIAIQYYETC